MSNLKDQSFLMFSSQGGIANRPTQDMCQTEYGFMEYSDLDGNISNRFTRLVFLDESRIYEKTSQQVFKFGCDLSHLSEEGESKHKIPNCPPLRRAPRSSDELSYRQEYLIPWLRSSLMTLNAFAITFRGSSRDLLMLEWLKSGAMYSECPKLVGLIERSGETKKSFVEMVNLIKREIKWTPEVLQDARLKKLLSWQGAEREKSLHSAWDEFLNLYQEIDAETLNGNNNVLRGLLRNFCKQNQFLMNFCFTFPLDTTFIQGSEGDEKIVSLPTAHRTELDHIRLMCIIQCGLETWQLCFGTNTPLPALYGFKAFGEPSGSPERPRQPFNQNGNSPVKRPFQLSQPGQQRPNKFPRTIGNPGADARVGNKLGSSQTSHPVSQPQVRRVKSLTLTPKDNINLFKPYSPSSLSSYNDLIITVLFDTGNECPTFFPQWLLKYAKNVKEISQSYQCAGKASNMIDITHEGIISFMCPTDDGQTCKIELNGVFISEKDSQCDNEIIISRHDMPLVPGFNAGVNFPVTSKLRDYPEISLGLNNRLRQDWTVLPPPRIKRVKQADENTWRDSIDVSDLSQRLEIELGDYKDCCTAERLIWKLHVRFGHPSIERFRLSLACIGLQVPTPTLTSICSNCSICNNRIKPKTPINEDASRGWKRGSLAMIDLTEPTVIGCGGFRYISTIYDDSTGFVSAYNCSKKIDALIHLSQYLEANPHITMVRTDGAGELTGEEMTTMVTKLGVGTEGTAPGSSTSLGGVERAHRTLKDKISILMLDLGLEARGDMWPWFTAAACDTINYSVSQSRGNRMPAHLRDEALTTHGKPSGGATLPQFGFGEAVFFQTPREKTKKDAERLPNGARIGFFLSIIHTGMAQVIGVQKERATLWLVHSHLLSRADPDILGKLRSSLAWVMTSTDDKKLREVIVDNQGRAGPEMIYSYPYESTKADFHLSNLDNSSSDSSNSSDPSDNESNSDGEQQPPPTDTTLRREIRKRGAVPKKTAPPSKRRNNKTERLTARKQTSNRSRQSRVKHIQRAIQTVVVSDGIDDLVAVGPVHIGKIPLVCYKDERIQIHEPIKYLQYSDVRPHATPALLLGNRVLPEPQPRCARAAGKGSFHLKYGYVAADEALPEEVSAGVFNAADLKEWTSIIDNQVLLPACDLPEGAKACRTRFRRTYKLTVHSERVPKSRFLVCETNDPRQVEITTEMPNAWIRRMVVIAGLSRGWSAATIDVKTAFLLVPLPPEHGDIYVKLPSHLPEVITQLGFTPGAIHKLQKSLYGLKEAPRLFNEFLAEQLAPLGWDRIVGGVYRRPDNSGYLVAYVDDLLVLSENPIADLEKVATLLKCSDLLPVDTKAQRHVGMEITATPTSFFFDCNAYIAGIPAFEEDINALSPQHTLKELSPHNNLPHYEDDAEIDSHQVFPYHHINLFQQIMGTLGWLALCHPTFAARHGELAVHTHQPTPKIFRITKGVLKEIKRDGVAPLEMTAISNPEFRLWVDCAVHKHAGRRGWVLQLADSSWPVTNRTNLVAWRSVKDKMKHASSTSGEVNALQQALEDVEDHFYVAQTIVPNAKVRILSDSMSGILQVANGGHSIKDKERAKYIKYLISALPFPCLGLNHVSGLIQLADPLTKIKALNWFTDDSSLI